MNHSFNVQVAERFGIEEAIIIELIYWWIHKNECEEEITMYQEDKMWCRCSADGFTKYIPYMNAQKIGRVLRELEKVHEVIIVGNFNNKATNQTKWYTFTDEFKKELKKAGYDFSKMKNGIFKNEKSYNSIINNPINKDNNIKDNKKKNNNNIIQKRFSKPTVEDIYDYVKEKGFHFDAEQFYDYYESKGWVIGKSPMKDWKAACRTWERQRISKDKKEEKEEMPAGMTREQWSDIQDWMGKKIPRIKDRITPDLFLSLKALAHFKSQIVSEILQDINNSDYEGDIKQEFDRLTLSDEYRERVME